MSTGAPQSAAAIAAEVRAGRLRAVEVAAAALARIEAHNAWLGAFTDVTEERARAEAAAVDRKVAAGEDPGPLAGVPYAVKNLFDIAGLPTRAGSRINRDDPPAARDAVLIERLQAAGAVLVGGLNMGEYAYDFTGENAHDGPSRNPHDPAHMSGGSSGGSGTAVAAGMVPLALGSDTNGSIRVPASFCGLFGLKPTYGRLPRTGSFPFVDSLDHLGPFAHARRSTWRWPTTRCRGRMAAMRPARRPPSSRSRRCWNAVPRACASRSPGAISARAARRRRSPRSTAARRRWA